MTFGLAGVLDMGAQNVFCRLTLGLKIKEVIKRVTEIRTFGYIAMR